MCSSLFSFSSRSSSPLWLHTEANFLYSFEALARICVSGFIFDPEVPASSIFHIFSTRAEHPVTVAAEASNEPALSRQFSLTQKLNRINRNMARPFILNSTTSLEHPVEEKVKHAVQQSMDAKQGTFFSQMNPFQPNEKSDYVSLPFRLSLKHANDKTHRNVPYLRHSWSRIDFIAIVSFWTSFILATVGVEHGSQHIGIFRALSVLRTARLLTVTSGTTVRFYLSLPNIILNGIQTIMHSLKTALPLLTSVAYFVLFAMILFS